MRVLSHQEIHAVSGGATPAAAAAGSTTSPVTLFFLGLMWALAGIFGTGFKGIL